MAAPRADRAPSFKAAVVPVTPFEQNCALIWNEVTKAGAIVDPGGDIDRIMTAIDQVGLMPEKILLTHGHIDHAGGAAELRAKLKVPIEGPHLADKFLLDHLEEQGEAYGFPARNVIPDRWLSDGDTVAIGEHIFEILHCPGHSPGSVVFKSPTQKFLIMGDVLFQGSIGRSDLPQGDHDTLINSIKTKLLVLEDNYAFLCGHGSGSTIGLERRTNPFLR
ncbi:MAG: MBL fold metallo-hydrolase [Hyphomicrobiaceae bacterium]|nr:MBL fold metallo-hydrolase [Hyphomicrobiaceae bacterium]